MSKTKLKHASYSIRKLMQNSKFSYATRASTEFILNRTIKDLDFLGYQLDNINQLKQKHIYNLVDYWQEKELNNGTIKNRMSALRYVCKTLNKSNIIKSNNYYDIAERSYIPNTNKAKSNLDFRKINNNYLRISLELQKAFGLRREECIKIIPKLADKGDHIFLQGTWTKGGIERKIPITNENQRDILNQATKIAGEGSLIPQEKSYIEQRNLYDRLTHVAGLRNLHGLRHDYAQKRYLELTGWNAPINNGKKRIEMTKEEKTIDEKIREIISNELGHSRTAITKIYLM